MHKALYFVMLAISLSGCLPAVFTAATSSTVSVAKDRSVKETINDAAISTKIKAALIKKGFRELYTKIDVDVVQGRVLYTGSIEKEEDAMAAVDIAWQQDGVKEVINELKVDEKSNYFDTVQYTKDSMITAQIKAKTFMNRDIKFVNYTVITSKNIVYLFGIARSEDELEKVANIAAKIRGVEKVVSHAKIREDSSSSDDS